MHDPWSDKLWKVVHMLGIYSPKGASMVSREQAECRLPFSPLRRGAFVWALCREGFNAIVTARADSLILGTNLFSCLIYLTYLASSLLPLLNLNFNKIIPESYYKKGYSSDNCKYSPSFIGSAVQQKGIFHPGRLPEIQVNHSTTSAFITICICDQSNLNDSVSSTVKWQ